MMSVIGYKRVLLILILIGFNALLAAGLYLYIAPLKQDTERQLSALKGEISARRGEIAQLQDDFTRLEAQRVRFEELRSLGFFNSQDRVIAREKFDEMQGISRVLSAKYVVEAADIETNAELEKAEHVVLGSPVKVEIDALDDIDIFRFIYLLETSFPGHAGIESIDLKRGARVNEAVLRQIGSGQPVVLVSGTVDFVWRSAVPKDSVQGIVTTPQN